MAKPFLKWAGGKSQLISSIAQAIPSHTTQRPFTYIEPFVGSGAVLFWMLNNFPTLEKAVINDINPDLINTYRIITGKPRELISLLKSIEQEYHALENKPEAKKEYYYAKRTLYNKRIAEESSQAALFIFLNRTCFNGLYRVNQKNQFNVPIGNYKTPRICDAKNILDVSETLKKVDILCGDYQNTLQHATENTFFYLDPPYKPLSQTSSFNAYAKDNFDDAAQKQLRNFCQNLNQQGHTWVLSNSDPKEENSKGGFFDKLYADFSIQRVQAKRSINANATKRGLLNELLITNHKSTIQTVL